MRTLKPVIRRNVEPSYHGVVTRFKNNCGDIRCDGIEYFVHRRGLLSPIVAGDKVVFHLSHGSLVRPTATPQCVGVELE